jgi:hypothetical protein
MLTTFFHRWEERLASSTRTERVVRPFDWGVDWIPSNGHPFELAHSARVRHWIDEVMADTDAFFTPSPTTEYAFSPAGPNLAKRAKQAR